MAQNACRWDLCMREGMRDLPVCAIHAEEIWKHVDRRGLAVHPDARHEAPAQFAGGAGHPVVYYIETQPGIVKIGTTCNLRNRVANLRLGFNRVLAVEPGGYPKESFRHRQFADIRIGRREDFRRNDDLDEHMREIRTTFGEPDVVDAQQIASNDRLLQARKQAKADSLGITI